MSQSCPTRDALIACVDSGTTAVKAAVIDTAGHVVASAERSNRALRQDGARREQDMMTSIADMEAVLSKIATVHGPRIEALVVTAQGDGTWPLDAEGAPVGPALTWLDGRASALLRELDRDGRLAEVEATTSSRPTGAAQSVQFLWLQRNMPERHARIRHLLRLKEWLFLSLTGEMLAEPTSLLPVWGDWRTGEVSSTVETALGLTAGIAFLPELRPMPDCWAPLLSDVADRIGIPVGVPVLLGPSDVQATAVGLGIGRPGRPARGSIFGTSAIHMHHLAVPAEMPAKPPGAMIQQMCDGAGYLCFHPSFNGGMVLDAVERIFGGPPPRTVVPDYSRLLLLPFFASGGERAPVTNASAAAVIDGLTADTRPMQIAWAAREGLAFLAHHSHCMMSPAASPLALGGGLAEDGHFATFLATVTSEDVWRNATPNAGLSGLAALAAKHLLGQTLPLPADQSLVTPGDEPLRAYSSAKFERFRALLDVAPDGWAQGTALDTAAAVLNAGEDGEVRPSN